MIDRLEQQVGTRLPDDVRSFFTLADGIDDGYADEYLLSFWPIERIIDETTALRAGQRIDSRDTPLADFLINSWCVFLRRFDEGRVGVWVEGADSEFHLLRRSSNGTRRTLNLSA